MPRGCPSRLDSRSLGNHWKHEARLGWGRGGGGGIMQNCYYLYLPSCLCQTFALVTCCSTLARRKGRVGAKRHAGNFSLGLPLERNMNLSFKYQGKFLAEMIKFGKKKIAQKLLSRGEVSETYLHAKANNKFTYFLERMILQHIECRRPLRWVKESKGLYMRTPAVKQHMYQLGCMTHLPEGHPPCLSVSVCSCWLLRTEE